jgi:hypothetical protein
MKKSRLGYAIALSVLTALAGTALAQPATDAFTYQGRLTVSGVNQSGNFDFQFGLWDSPVAGTQLGPTITITPIAVSGGLFTANLNFGQQFNSSRRWLEIAVRVSGGGSYTTLVPRQELTAAPHAEGLVLPIAATTAVDTALSITSTGGTGILGTAGTGAGVESGGLWGISTASGGNGVRANADTGTNAFAVWANAAQGNSVVGTSALGAAFDATATTGTGVLGTHDASTGTAAGVEGDTLSTDGNANAILGQVLSTSPGGSSTAVRGVNSGTGGSGIGVWGSQAGSGYGVLGSVTGAGLGVFGESGTGGTGVLALGGAFGLDASGNTGVRGTGGLAAGYGVLGVGGTSNVGVRGESSAGTTVSFGGYFLSTATGGNGVYGECSTGANGFGVWGKSTTGSAGVFSGNVSVSGTLSKGAGSFKIDHPLDPANKYLYHSFVESPDMMNIYNGNAQLDGAGAATITMPDWFEVLNTEFRYQLTAIGAPGPNLYIAQTMKNRQFVIAGGTPNGVVSWQVTGIRQDAFANAHRIPVEELKRPEERGLYLHPELYGLPESASVDVLKARPGPLPAERARSAQDDAIRNAPAPAPAVFPRKEGN